MQTLEETSLLMLNSGFRGYVKNMSLALIPLLSKHGSSAEELPKSWHCFLVND